jgi:secondary thiamine-phosphate synthase enzyme
LAGFCFLAFVLAGLQTAIDAGGCDEGPDDMPAHIKAALMAVSLSIPVTGGRLAPGTWQGLYLFEHRERLYRSEIVLHLA